MVRKLMNVIRKRKKGQLFLLEVFIALSVLILLMIALFQVEFTSVPTYQDDLSEIGYDVLNTLNDVGTLKPLVYNAQTSELINSLDNSLPENVIWRLSIRNSAESSIYDIYWDRIPPADATIGVTDYILYGYGTGLDTYRVVHLELWRLIG